VLTKSTVETFGTAGQSPSSGVTIRDSVVTGSCVKNIQDPHRFHRVLNAKNAGVGLLKVQNSAAGAVKECWPSLKKCGNSLPPVAKFCTQCKEKVV